MAPMMAKTQMQEMEEIMRRPLSDKQSKHMLLRIKIHVKKYCSHLSCISQQKKQNRFTEHCEQDCGINSPYHGGA